ncbi:MAG: transketolase [Oscillospiraceae bacterium]|nr:transketolase [Oscillospiraceae bacterium]
MEKENIRLEQIAEGIRLVTLHTLAGFGSGHIGGAASIIETLAVLYGGEMKFDPKNPDWSERDRLVMSKGHAGPALYSTLALSGFFPKEMLAELNRGGGHLPSHCDRTKTPGVDMTTGSLGQGMSTAIGIALGGKMDGSDRYTYLILGDGECDEGQVWEGAMFAAHNKLDHLIAFVDRNGQQLDGFVEKVMDTGDMGEKFRAFNWYTQDVDGHDIGEIRQAIKNAKEHSGQPSMIILHTVKGYGITFAEGIEGNHHMTISQEQLEEAGAEIYARLERLAALRGDGKEEK